MLHCVRKTSATKGNIIHCVQMPINLTYNCISRGELPETRGLQRFDDKWIYLRKFRSGAKNPLKYYNISMQFFYWKLSNNYLKVFSKKIHAYIVIPQGIFWTPAKQFIHVKFSLIIEDMSYEDIFFQIIIIIICNKMQDL